MLVAIDFFRGKEVFGGDVLRLSDGWRLSRFLFVDDECFKQLIYLHRVKQVGLLLKSSFHFRI